VAPVSAGNNSNVAFFLYSRSSDISEMAKFVTSSIGLVGFVVI